MARSGPYPVSERRNKVSYLTDEKDTQLYHINLLKKYHSRSQATQTGSQWRTPSINEILEPIQSVHLYVVEATESFDENDLPATPYCKVNPILLSLVVKDPVSPPHLTKEQSMQVKELVDSFSNVLSETPGCT